MTPFTTSQRKTHSKFKMFIRHSIDIFNSNYVSGWFFNRWNKKRNVKLTFKSGNNELGSTTADIYRKDLEIKRIHPTGFCGFNFNYPTDFDITAFATLDIFLDDNKKPFLQIPTTGLTKHQFQHLPNILFMHIPKTAGTSFNAFMRMHIPPSKIKIHLESHPSKEYPGLHRSHSYLAGHLTLEKLKTSFDLSGFDCFCILRSPDAHLHSHLNWLKGVAVHGNSEFFRQHNPVIQKLARKIADINFEQIDEIATFVKNIRHYELDFFDNIQTRYFLGYRPEKVDDKDYKNAADNLKFFKHVGRTETYKEFIQFIINYYQLPDTENPTVFNKAIEPPLYDITDPLVQEITAPLTATDKKLYTRVKALFG